MHRRQRTTRSRCTHVGHWSTFQFDRTFADISAEESVPKLVTTERSEDSASLLRRGIALRVEHGFASTPAGRQEYELKLAAIVCAATEVIAQTALLALLEAPSAYGRHFTRTDASTCLADMFQQDLFFFASMQKHEHSFFLLNKEVCSMFDRKGITHDTYIVPPRMMVYATAGDRSEIDYQHAGYDARKNLKSTKGVSSIGDKVIYETCRFESDNSGVEVDQMVRERMIGGHFMVRYFGAGRFQNWEKEYDTSSCNTDVYCAADDSLHTVGIDNCLVALRKMGENAGNDGNDFFKKWFKHRYQDGMNQEDGDEDPYYYHAVSEWEDDHLRLYDKMFNPGVQKTGRADDVRGHLVKSNEVVPLAFRRGLLSPKDITDARGVFLRGVGGNTTGVELGFVNMEKFGLEPTMLNEVPGQKMLVDALNECGIVKTLFDKIIRGDKQDLPIHELCTLLIPEQEYRNDNQASPMLNVAQEVFRQLGITPDGAQRDSSAESLCETLTNMILWSIFNINDTLGEYAGKR